MDKRTPASLPSLGMSSDQFDRYLDRLIAALPGAIREQSDNGRRIVYRLGDIALQIAYFSRQILPIQYERSGADAIARISLYRVTEAGAASVMIEIHHT